VEKILFVPFRERTDYATRRVEISGIASGFAGRVSSDDPSTAYRCVDYRVLVEGFQYLPVVETQATTGLHEGAHL
jgi:hypothetical protein